MIKEKINYFWKSCGGQIRQNFLLILCVFVFIGGLLAEDVFIRQKERIVFCDVGQGDGIFINLKNGEQILIDGGPDNKFVGCVGKYMPYFDRVIEYIIISHPDKDHFVGAVEILKRYDVKRILINGDNADIPEYKEFLKLAGAKADIGRDNSDFETGGAKIDFLYPFASGGDEIFSSSDANLKSLIFKFSYGETSALFTGDAPIKAEEYLLRKGVNLKSDILKLGHHGSKTSSSEDFLRAVAPEFAIISVGADNSFGHPSYSILKRLERLGIFYKRTDEEGDVEIEL